MEPKKPVLSKTDFVQRYAKGEFGNASPTWDNIQDWARDGGAARSGLYHIRNRVAGGPTYYDLTAPETWVKWWKLVKEGVDPGTLYISQMAPTDKTIIQGEVQDGVWGLELTYTYVKKPMRDALRESTLHVTGLVGGIILSTYMDERSLEWLKYLLETYLDHVVEFSTYSVEWGTIPGYNTVFWEVRKY